MQIVHKQAKQHQVSFSPDPFVVKRLRANEVEEIERRYPADPETGRVGLGYFAAIMATVVVDIDGMRALTESEILNLDSSDFWELWRVVGGDLGLIKGSDAKN